MWETKTIRISFTFETISVFDSSKHNFRSAGNSFLIFSRPNFILIWFVLIAVHHQWIIFSIYKVIHIIIEPPQMSGSTVMWQLALLPHNKKVQVQIQTGIFWCGVCMFSLSIHGFSTGTLDSSRSPKSWFLGWLVSLDRNVSAVAFQQTGNMFRVYPCFAKQ